MFFFFFQAEDGIRDLVRSRGLGDVYKRQVPYQRCGSRARRVSLASTAMRDVLYLTMVRLPSDPKGSRMLANGNRRPIVVDLFAGAGGLSLGFEQAGFDIAVAVEFDPVHSATHEYNFPCSAVICADVRQLSGDGIRSAAGLGDVEIDVLVGGPPCQGFSLIGHRVLDDPRNDLVFHFLRLVDELQPRAFVMENVAGMATGQHTRLLEELIERFKTIGYSLRLPYQILNAADYGIPQNRRRLFLLGARSDIILPNYPVKQTVRAGTKSNQKGMLELPLGLPFGPTVADAICDIPDIELFESLFESDAVSYTHLRAHETVLDLVCRLLLEKKTYTKPKHASSCSPTINHTKQPERRQETQEARKKL